MSDSNDFLNNNQQGEGLLQMLQHDKSDKSDKSNARVKGKRSRRMEAKLGALEDKCQDFRAEEHVRSYTSYCPQLVGFVYSVIMWETYFVFPFWLCVVACVSLVFKVFNAAPFFSALCICLGTYFLYELLAGPELQEKLGTRPKSKAAQGLDQQAAEDYENAVKTLTGLYTQYLRASKVLAQQKAQNSFLYVSQSITSLVILAFVGANVQMQSLVFMVLGFVAVVPGFVGRFLKTDDPNDTTYQRIVKTLRRFSEKREVKEVKEVN